MQPFFTWNGCDLLCFGLVSIGNKSADLHTALPFTGNTELILLKQNLCWYCYQIPNLKS